MWFEPFHRDNIKCYDSSNFIVKTTAETCRGCGLCSKRCPMDALVMKSYPKADAKRTKKAQVPSLIIKNCLGCGVCVVKCPTKSLTLKQKGYETPPPKTAIDWTKDYWRVKKENA